MKIIIAHNRYQQRGGEDSVFEQEASLLVSNGHQVEPFVVDNEELSGVLQKVTTALSITYNRKIVGGLLERVSAFSPDIVHFHNIFPMLTPGALDAVAAAGVPVVLTLHNYRAICAGALLMRDGKPCELCVGRSKFPGVKYACYRRSRIGSAATTAMGIALRRVVLKHPHMVKLIALTEFARRKFVVEGYPSTQIAVRPNFMEDKGVGGVTRGPSLLFVGRLSPEKGCDTIINAARGLAGQVEVIGDGPEYEALRALAPPNVVFLGACSSAQVLDRVRHARALLLPSRWYEGLPMTAIEAMSSGTPIIASNIGSLAEIVSHNINGRLVPVDDVAAWNREMQIAIDNQSEYWRMGQNARLHFETRYSSDVAYASISDIYNGMLRCAM